MVSGRGGGLETFVDTLLQLLLPQIINAMVVI